jgi:hypothetical protein
MRRIRENSIVAALVLTFALSVAPEACGKTNMGLPRVYDLAFEIPPPEVQTAVWEVVNERFGHVYAAERLPVYHFDHVNGMRMFLGSVRKGHRVTSPRWHQFGGRLYYAIPVENNPDIELRQSGLNGRQFKGDGIAWVDGHFLVPVEGTYKPVAPGRTRWW